MDGYLNNEEAIKRYGKGLLKKMDDTGLLKGITGVIDNGIIYYPISDYELALKAVNKKRVHIFELD